MNKLSHSQQSIARFGRQTPGFQRCFFCAGSSVGLERRTENPEVAALLKAFGAYDPARKVGYKVQIPPCAFDCTHGGIGIRKGSSWSTCYEGWRSEFESRWVQSNFYRLRPVVRADRLGLAVERGFAGVRMTAMSPLHVGVKPDHTSAFFINYGRTA